MFIYDYFQYLKIYLYSDGHVSVDIDTYIDCHSEDCAVDINLNKDLKNRMKELYQDYINEPQKYNFGR